MLLLFFFFFLAMTSSNMEDPDSAPPLPRSARSTRGKWMSRLLDEEAEADEKFWSQEAFEEEAEDIEYEAEDEVVDEFDSDFDDDETALEVETEEEEERYPVKKKKIVPPGKKSVKDKKKLTAPKKKGLASIEAAAAASTDSPHPKSKSPFTTSAKQSDLSSDLPEILVESEAERAVRKSTRTAVIVRQAERDALRAALQTTIKPVKKKREGEEKRMTQEEMLWEAAQTEILNRQNLEKMLAREEEVKQKAIIHKNLYSGPQIRFHSKNGRNVLEFTKVATFPEELFGQAEPYPEKSVCVVTGLPAKYVDPLTGLPYATKEAFKIIREGVDREEDLCRKEASEVPWRKSRTGRSSSTRIGVIRLKYKLSDSMNPFLQAGSAEHASNPAEVDRRLVESAGLPTPLPIVKVPGGENSNDVTQSASQPPATISMPADTGRRIEMESTIDGKSSFGRQQEHTSVRTLMLVGDNASEGGISQNLDIPQHTVEIVTLREEPDEADFMLDDLDINLPLQLGSNLSQHSFIEQTPRDLEYNLEISPSQASTLLPLDVLRMTDFAGMEFL